MIPSQIEKANKIKPEDLSKDQLVGVLREMTLGFIDLLKSVEFKNESMMDCWLVHPDDDSDCDMCPIVNGCRGVRKFVESLQSTIAAKDQKIKQLIGVVKLAYRKHHLGHESIGWDELGGKLCDVLCELMGGEEFQKWLQTLEGTEK
jgi:hypothetical protein